MDILSTNSSKRMRLDDGCNNNLSSTLNSATKNNARWTCAGDTSLVEPEILEDMGVSMLEDEEISCESLKQLPSHECTASPTGSEGSRRPAAEIVENVFANHPTIYRESSFDTVNLDR